MRLCVSTVMCPCHFPVLPVSLFIVLLSSPQMKRVKDLMSAQQMIRLQRTNMVGVRRQAFLFEYTSRHTLMLFGVSMLLSCYPRDGVNTL